MKLHLKNKNNSKYSKRMYKGTKGDTGQEQPQNQPSLSTAPPSVTSLPEQLLGTLWGTKGLDQGGRKVKPFLVGPLSPVRALGCRAWDWWVACSHPSSPRGDSQVCNCSESLCSFNAFRFPNAPPYMCPCGGYAAVSICTFSWKDL